MIHAHVEVEKNIKNVTENNLKKRKSEIRLMISDFFFVFNSFFEDGDNWYSVCADLYFADEFCSFQCCLVFWAGA